MAAANPENSGIVTLTTLLLTDLVDSTRLVETLGDERASEVWARHDHRARELMVELGGREIDKSDGFLLLFGRPIEAVRYALAYHRNLAELSERLGVELRARCGIHLGEVFLRENSPEDIARGAKPVEVEGLAKPAAARVMALGVGRQTLLTRAAFDLARRAAVGDRIGAQPLRWLAHGPYLFKGVTEPQEVFEVGEVGVAPLSEPPDSEKARRAVAPGEEPTLGWRPALDQRIPRRPNWTLREKLGEGGFGEVWLAAHEKTGDKRVFKFCFEADRLSALQREVTLFRLLRETLGQREDIARILDWDFDEAPYLLESEYTEGGSLLEWSARQEGIDRVPLATRLELVAQVAEALAAAHSVGVLHKDVKPANVLIQNDREGRPRAVLTDFGIGLITDRDLLAARGITSLGLTGVTLDSSDSSSAGTQMYMAPELLSGAAPSIQADIYALGVLLYQMVVGDLARPLAPGWRREVEDDILCEDIAGFVDGSPERRPRSAQEIAERLRSLDDRRVRRETERRALEVAEKAHRRKRLLAVVASVSTVFLLVVTVLALQALQAKKEAKKGRAQAEGLIDFMLFDLHESLEIIGRLDLLDQVARGSREYFKSVPEHDGSVESIFKRGSSLVNIGDVLLPAGDTGAASASYAAAEALFEDALAENPGAVKLREGLVRARLALGDVRYDRGQWDAASDAFRSSLLLSEEALEQQPEDERWRYGVAASRYRISQLERRLGDTSAALESCRRALSLTEELTAGDLDEIDWRHWKLRLVVQSQYASLLEAQGDVDAALQIGTSVLAQAARLAEEDPGNTTWRSRLAWIHFQNGSAYQSAGALEQALESFEASSSGYRELSQRDPTRVHWRAALGQSQMAVAGVHRRRGDLAAALALSEAAIVVFEQLAAIDPKPLSWPWSLAGCYRSIALIRRQQDDTTAALEAYLEERMLRERLVTLSPSDNNSLNDLARNHFEVGRLYALRREPDRAREEWARAVEIIEPVVARSDRNAYRDTYSRALLELGRTGAAQPLVEELLADGWDQPEFLKLVRESGLGGAEP